MIKEKPQQGILLRLYDFPVLYRRCFSLCIRVAVLILSCDVGDCQNGFRGGLFVAFFFLRWRSFWRMLS